MSGVGRHCGAVAIAGALVAGVLATIGASLPAGSADLANANVALAPVTTALPLTHPIGQ